MYSFLPHAPLALEREVVLNHRLRANGRLNPRGSIDGLLLGIGQTSIPDKYYGHSVLMTFEVFEGRGECYESQMRLQIDYRRKRNRANNLSYLRSRRACLVDVEPE